MKYIKFGNILDVTEGIIIHGCNAQGVMGSGLALQVRQKYPEAFRSYYNIHQFNGLLLGDVDLVQVTDKLYIANAITQQHYGTENKRYVSYKAVQECFSKLTDLNMPIHYPMIGAGLAKGDWSIISEIIDVELKDAERTLWLQD